MADRDTSLKLAEEMELKSKAMQEQAELMLEEGFEEAYQEISTLREKIKKQDREIVRLLALVEELKKAKGTADNSTVPSPAS